MSGFWEWWTRFIRWLPWPMEESAPSDATLLLVGTLPFFALTLGVRVVPWFKRPESYHLNALVGWILAEIVGVFIWHHP
jgi:hypothetical protein